MRTGLGRLRKSLGREKAAVVVALVAGAVALSSTGYAAQVPPLAKRAFTADKAKVATKASNTLKLEGLAASQVAAIPGPGTDAQTLNGLTAQQIASTSGPATALSASMFTYRTDSFSVDAEGQTSRVKANCQAGEQAIAGGFDTASGAATVTQDSPATDGSGWQFSIWGQSGNNLAAEGSVWVVCMKVG